MSVGKLSEDRLDLIARYMGQEPARNGHAAPEHVEESPVEAVTPVRLVAVAVDALDAPLHGPLVRMQHLPRYRLRLLLVRTRLPMAIFALSLVVAYLATRA